jgi:hypothetical protein
VADQLEAGTVWVNDWHMVSAAYPFGGFKQSGLGRELGPHALDEYTEEKFTTSTCPAGWSAGPTRWCSARRQRADRARAVAGHLQKEMSWTY